MTYVVTDATGPHRVLIGQEPYTNAWAPLGTFTAGAHGIRVTLSTASRGPRGATYVAADAIRFARTTPTTSHAIEAVAGPAAVRAPGPPQDVNAVAGDRRATVSWLAPSKDGGAPIVRFLVSAQPGGRSCVSAVGAPGEDACVVHGLSNGAPYTFTVRAVNRAGTGDVSSASGPVRPLGVAQIRVVAAARALRYGERVVYRVLTSLAASGGTVLFSEDGRVIAGCQSARVVKGRASCAVRLTATSRHVVLARFSGDRLLAGTERALAVLVARAPSAFLTAGLPATVPSGVPVRLRAWHLPGTSTGTVVF